MPYTSAEGRQEILDVLAGAADRLAVALGLLGGAYELADEHSAELLEDGVFRPVQLAYGRLRRTHAEFAARSELAGREFDAAAQGAPSRGLKGLLESAAGEVAAADQELAGLQDSMLPVEVGDVQLRASIEEVRGLLGGVGARTRELLRTFGR